MFTKEKFLKEGKNRYIRILDKDHFFTIQKKLLELGFEYCTIIPKTDYRENIMKYFIIFCYTHNGIIHPRPGVDDIDKSTELTDAELYDVKYKYNIGDVVKYVDDGKVYPDYDLIFEHLNFEDKKHNPDKNIPIGSQVTIFNRIVHPFSHQPLYAIRFKNEELLIDEEGLESIEDNSWKIAIYCDDSDHGSKIIEYLTSLKPNVINPREFNGTSVKSFYYVDSDDNCIRGRIDIPEGYKVINSSSLIEKKIIKSEPIKEHDKIEDGYYNFNFKNGENNYIIKIINNNYYYILESLKTWSGPTLFTNRGWINDYDITPASDDKVKWMDICIEKNRFVDKHELPKLLPKETVENTWILSKDYIEGKYYYSKFNSGYGWHEIIFKYNKNPEKRAFIQLTRKKFLYDNCCTSDSFTSGEIRRFATEEEIKWLDACIKANKFIEQNEIPNIMTKIPINRIITEACLQDKPNIILENYNIKGMDDITFAHDGQLCGGAKLGSKNTKGCTGLSCTDCKINCNKISQNEVLKWLFRDFQGNLQQELDDIKDSVLFRYNTLIPSIDNVKCYTVNNSEESITSNSKIKFIASEEVQIEIPKLTINKVNINFLTK